MRPTEFTLTVETDDDRLVVALMQGRNMTNGEPVLLPGGIEITHLTGDGLEVSGEAARRFLFSGVIGLSTSLTASYIYDHLKAEQPVCQINEQFVKIDPAEIERAVRTAIAVTGENQPKVADPGINND